MKIFCTFICAAFKSRTEGSNTQRVSAPTIALVPATASTFYDLNCFGHVIYSSQNSAKPLTYPNTLCPSK